MYAIMTTVTKKNDTLACDIVMGIFKIFWQFIDPVLTHEKSPLFN